MSERLPNCKVVVALITRLIARKDLVVVTWSWLFLPFYLNLNEIRYFFLFFLNQNRDFSCILNMISYELKTKIICRGRIPGDMVKWILSGVPTRLERVGSTTIKWTKILVIFTTLLNKSKLQYQVATTVTECPSVAFNNSLGG